MNLLQNFNAEAACMEDQAKLEEFIQEMHELFCLICRDSPESQEAIMDHFQHISDLARRAFGWTLTVPVAYPNGLSADESARLDLLRTKYIES